MKALLFGSIGVFCDSSDLQRQGYNLAFQEAGLDLHWDEAEYRELLKIPGGLSRLVRYGELHELGSNFNAAELHRRKTELYADMLKEGKSTLRPGVMRLIDDARKGGIAIGWITSTETSNLDAVIAQSHGSLSLEHFDIVKHRGNVTAPKPDPAAYLEAIAELQVDTSNAIAIEDTAACVGAAVDAGVMCIATPHRYSLDQDFAEAIATVDQLGDADHEAEQLGGISVISNGMVTLAQLEQLTTQAAPLS